MDNKDRFGEECQAYASPPCFMHELGPAYFGYLDCSAQLALLGQVRDDARHCQGALAQLSVGACHAEGAAVLYDIRADLTEFLLMIERHIRCMGRTANDPCPTPGSMAASSLEHDPTASFTDVQARMLLRLAQAIPRIYEDDLRADLAAMLIRSLHDVERYTEVVSEE